MRETNSFLVIQKEFVLTQMKTNKKYFLALLMMLLLVLLTGCFQWLGEFVDDSDNSTLRLSGSVDKIYFQTVNAQNPGFRLPNLAGDMQAIVAISPCETGDHDLQITLDNLPTSGAQMLPTNFLESSLLERRMSDDYFIYDDFEQLTSVAPLNQIFPQSDQRQFWVSRPCGKEFYQVTAQKAKSASADTRIEIWWNSDLEINSAQLDLIRTEFDRDIYKDLCDEYKFGEPLDIDGNGKIILLITPLESNIAGFFHEINFADHPSSNRADMIYLNSTLLTRNQMNQVYSNIAHEFQHLLFCSEKIRAKDKYPWGNRFSYCDLWINEGFSMLASVLTGYIDLAKDSRVFDKYYGYFSAPNRDGLLTWEDNRLLSNYGSAGLFALYLFDHYGGSKIIQEITRTGDRIEKVISQTAGHDFEDIFMSWMTANMIDRFANIPANRYQYPDISLQGVPQFKELTLLDRVQILGRGVQYYLLDEQSSNKWFNLAESSGYSLPEINVSIITFH